ncbi:MAG: DUF2769 domain-containing protein [Thermoleophilia bacterium]|nr:DUF2769 domain-containing protein [Thermoleophilia bacterium]
MEVPNTQENMSKCICNTCPTFIEGDKGFFCSLDRSDKQIVKKGCMCADCAIWAQYELKGGYFCAEGKAD